MPFLPEEEFMVVKINSNWGESQTRGFEAEIRTEIENICIITDITGLYSTEILIKVSEGIEWESVFCLFPDYTQRARAGASFSRQAGIIRSPLR